MNSPIYSGDSITYRKASRQHTFRENGPCEIRNDGRIYFSQINSQTYNRKRGPSTISPQGHVQYTDNRGNLSRTDGPAIIYSSGDKEYWTGDQRLAVEEFFAKYGVV